MEWLLQYILYILPCFLPTHLPIHHSGSAANSRSSTQMNSYSDSGYQEVSGYYSNMVTPRRSEGRSQSTSSAPSGSPSLAMGSRAEGQASAQVTFSYLPAPFNSVSSKVIFTSGKLTNKRNNQLLPFHQPSTPLIIQGFAKGHILHKPRSYSKHS